jgi:hypothetical protein
MALIAGFLPPQVCCALGNLSEEAGSRFNAFILLIKTICRTVSFMLANNGIAAFRNTQTTSINEGKR